MTDYNKAVGTAGTMIIRDNGTTVEYLIACSDGATYVGSYVWSGVVNGSAVGGTVTLSAGFGTRSLGVWTVSSSQTVTFHQNATGTQGLGGAADHSANINRTPPPTTAPGAPFNGRVSQITFDSMRVDWDTPSPGSSPIVEWSHWWDTDPDFAAPQTWIDNWNGSYSQPPGQVGLKLLPGTLYYMRANCKNQQGLWGPFSPTISARTLARLYVSDGSAWNPGGLYVDDGSTANLAELYISDGAAWRPPV